MVDMNEVGAYRAVLIFIIHTARLAASAIVIET